MCAYVSRYIQWMTEKRELLIASIGLLLLRVGFGGLMMINHGWGKFMSYSESAAHFPDPLGVSSPVSLALVVFAETFASLFVIFGAATRLATIPLIINMGVAAFVIHGGDPLHVRESALLYLVPFVTLLFTGGGRISIDALALSFARKRAGRG